jgi:hypothetical protein
MKSPKARVNRTLNLADGDATRQPEAQLQAFIERLAPEDQKLVRSLRAAVRKRLPAANEMVYDYPGNLVISYTPTDQGKDGILSTAARAGDVRLYFGNGKSLPDPKGLLLGSAGVRYIEVESASRLKHPDVEALIVAAIAKAPARLPAKRQGRLIIQKGGAKKKRSR